MHSTPWPPGRNLWGALRQDWLRSGLGAAGFAVHEGREDIGASWDGTGGGDAGQGGARARSPETDPQAAGLLHAA